VTDEELRLLAEQFITGNEVESYKRYTVKRAVQKARKKAEEKAIAARRVHEGKTRVLN